jgi:hypothetical protein
MVFNITRHIFTLQLPAVRIQLCQICFEFLSLLGQFNKSSQFLVFSFSFWSPLDTHIKTMFHTETFWITSKVYTVFSGFCSVPIEIGTLHS